MQKITPFLWFDGQAEEAANLYTSIFDNSKILEISRYGEAAPSQAGSVMTVEFELDGLRIVGLNGGPAHRFTEAVSFAVSCETQAEVDELWARLSEGGEEGPCGWLKDKYGLSWQVVPVGMNEMLNDADQARGQRAMKAMLGMKKIDLAAVREAADRV